MCSCNAKMNDQLLHFFLSIPVIFFHTSSTSWRVRHRINWIQSFTGTYIPQYIISSFFISFVQMFTLSTRRGYIFKRLLFIFTHSIVLSKLSRVVLFGCMCRVICFCFATTIIPLSRFMNFIFVFGDYFKINKCVWSRIYHE